MVNNGRSARPYKPLGKVVGGRYIVNAKKTAEPGGRRPRRQRRDQRLSPGWHSAQQYARKGFQLLAPTAAHVVDDPRARSQFLGYLLDYPLGWAADVCHHLPVVGPLVGHPARWVCRSVRGVEDACNWATGKVGFYLFLITCLTCIAPGQSVTNCCQQEQVIYCSELRCIHDLGCVICQEDTPNVTCWTPVTTMVSYHPNYTGVDKGFADHLDYIAAAVTACDLLAIQEVCGLVTATALTVVQHLPRTITLNTTADCYLRVTTPLDPSLMGMLDWFAREVSAISGLFVLLKKIPAAILAAFHGEHWFMLLSVVSLGLNGNPVKALALLVVYVEAAVAAPVSSVSNTIPCNPNELPPPCGLFFNGTEFQQAFCFNPQRGWVYHAPTLVRQENAHLLMETARQAAAYSAWGCAGLVNNTWRCCRIREARCDGCYSDCSWRDKRLTYERCGVSMVLSTYPGNATRHVRAKRDVGVIGGYLGAVAMIVEWIQTVTNWTDVMRTMKDAPPTSAPKTVEMGIAAYILPPNSPCYHQFVAEAGRKVCFGVAPEVARLHHSKWARLPFTPVRYRGDWALVPKGMYSTIPDHATGLISKDSGDENYQVLYSATGTFMLTGLSYQVLVLAVLAAFGAKWCIMGYGLILATTSALATPTTYGATAAASQYPDVALRCLVFLACCYARKLTPLLSPNMATAAILAGQFAYVGAGATECYFAFAGFMMAMCYMGVSRVLAGRLVLTHSYLRYRYSALLAWCDDRRVWFLGTLICPGAARTVALTAIIGHLTFLISANVLVSLVAPRDKRSLARAINRCGRAYTSLVQLCRKVIVWAAGERGVFWYQHMDGPLQIDGEYTDPYYPFATEVIVAEDIGRKLACGDTIKGHPVYARCGLQVAAGIGQLARGWKRLAPLGLKTAFHRNDFVAMAVTVTGYDTANHEGHICIMGTALRTWMGFGLENQLWTVFHGSRGRAIASETGATPPSVSDTTVDMCTYPLPKGMTCLVRCSCGEQAGFLPTRLGRLIPAAKVGSKWLNTAPLTLREAKGSSGAPLLCKCKGVKGMFQAVRTSHGAVIELKIVDLELAAPKAHTPVEDPLVNAPAVPATGKSVQSLVAPTGSGKSTLLPMHYYNLGYRVLVLNPSVATTVALPGYIKARFGFTPNCLAGDNVKKTGSRLTYSTYGMFLAGACKFDADIVICDECHATDPTSALGIGGALSAFEDHPTAKLLILATATPPGTILEPHPNITTVTLDDQGEVDFHGKKIKVDLLKKGRHLIFCPTKNGCVELADTLRQHGLNAVFYYRGCDIGKIPTTGDVVVVATDALMTGYTGNFDSVYDSNLMVTPKLMVDMAPTFTTSIQIQAVDTVTKIQRRGRTGRGKPGMYYQVCPGSSASGVLDAYNVYEAFDSGLAWFGLTTAEIYQFLDFYATSPVTPTLNCKLEEVSSVFEMIGHVQPSYIAKMKNRVDNFVYLHAAQYQLAAAAGAQAPSDSPVWAGLNGNALFPLMYRLGDLDDTKVVVSDMAGRLAQCYEEVNCGWTLGLASVGAAVAGMYVAVDMFGTVAIYRTWRVAEDSTSAWHSTPPDPKECMEECSFSVITEIGLQANSMLGEWLVKMGRHLGNTSVRWDHVIAELGPYLLSLVQYFAGLVTIQDAPALGSVMGFVGGLLSPLPIQANLFLACLGGAAASRMTNQRGAALFALAGGLGAVASTAALVPALMSVLTTYSSASATALVVLKLIDGKLPTLAECTSLAFGFASPGGVVVGAAAAVLVAVATMGESNVWMNRLLSMLNKGTTCDEYFVQITTLRQKIITLLESANLWAVFNTLAQWINRPEEELCTPRGVWEDFISSIGRVARAIIELCRGIVTRAASIPGIPLMGCDTPFVGRWSGGGVIRAKCGCGNVGIWQVTEGKAVPVTLSKMCKAYWYGGVPINATFEGVAKPIVTSWRTMATNQGFSTYVTYELRKGEVWITGASAPGIRISPLIPELAAAVAVNGVQVKALGGTGWREVGPYEVYIGEDEKGLSKAKVTLPVKLSEHTPDRFKEKVDNPLDIVTNSKGLIKYTEQTARILARATPIPGEDGESLEGWRPNRRVRTGSLDGAPRDTAGKDGSHALAGWSRDTTMGGLLDVYKDPPPPKPSPPSEVMSPTDKISLLLSEQRPGAEGKTLPLEPKIVVAQKPPSRDTVLWTAIDELQSVARGESHEAPSAEAFVNAASEILQKAKTPPQQKASGKRKAKTKHLEPAKPVVPKKVKQPTAKKHEIGSLGGEPAYSITSSSWTTEEECSWSYVWDVMARFKKTLRIQSPVATYTSGMLRDRNTPYVTDTSTIEQRARKVTILRARVELPELKHSIAAAKELAATVHGDAITLDDALAITSNRAAKSGVTGATVLDLKAGATRIVESIVEGLKVGELESPWDQVNIMMKSEIFVRTPKKPTKKPARIIAYPHLETRVAEKVVLGEIGPAVAKAVLGRAYGFQYTPQQRVARLLEMWRWKTRPGGFVCDTVCFDSTITPEDVDVECSIYQAATTNPVTKTMIKTLHDKLYQGGPMVTGGSVIGQRNCRASGVFTTSSSNTLTCYLKVTAAARRAQIQQPTWLICGDDCVCIFQSEGLEVDTRKLEVFAEAMKTMGAPQDCVPRPQYSLELLTSCSSNVSVAQTRGGLYHYMTRDPSIPLGRASVEGKGFNALGCWVGYLISNYPAIWVSRLLAVQLLDVLSTIDTPDTVTFEWYGNHHTVPLGSLPYIIQSLHGEECWKIQQYTPREVARVGEALQSIGMKPLRFWRRRARQVYAACVQRKGRLKFLAKTLLSWVHSDVVALDPKRVRASAFNPFDPYSEEYESEHSKPFTLASLALAFIFCVAITPFVVALRSG